MRMAREAPARRENRKRGGSEANARPRTRAEDAGDAWETIGGWRQRRWRVARERISRPARRRGEVNAENDDDDDDDEAIQRAPA